MRDVLLLLTTSQRGPENYLGVITAASLVPEPAASCRGVKVAILLNHCSCVLGEHQTQLKVLLAPGDVRRADLRIPQPSAPVKIVRCS